MNLNDLLQSKQPKVNEAWDDALSNVIDSISDAFGSRQAKPEQILRLLAQEAQQKLYNVVMNVHNWAKDRPHVEPDKEIHRVVQGWFEGGANLGTAPHSSGEDQPVSSHWIGSERTTSSVKAQQYIRNAIGFREETAPFLRELKARANKAMAASNELFANDPDGMKERDKFLNDLIEQIKQNPEFSGKKIKDAVNSKTDNSAKYAKEMQRAMLRLLHDGVKKHPKGLSVLSPDRESPEPEVLRNTDFSVSSGVKDFADGLIKQFLEILVYQAMSTVIDRLNNEVIRLQQDPKLKVGDAPYTDRTQRIIGDTTTMKAFDQIVEVAITKPALLKSKKMLPAFETMLGDAVYEYTKDRYGRPRVQASKGQADSKETETKPEKKPATADASNLKDPLSTEMDPADAEANRQAMNRQSLLNTIKAKYPDQPWGDEYNDDDPMVAADDETNTKTKPNVIQPVVLAIGYTDNADTGYSVFVKLDGNWYEASQAYQVDASAKSRQRLRGIVNNNHELVSDEYKTTLDSHGIIYIGPWAVQRQKMSDRDFRMLSVTDLQDWVKTTGRKVNDIVYKYPPYMVSPSDKQTWFHYENEINGQPSATKRKKERKKQEIEQSFDMERPK